MTDFNSSQGYASTIFGPLVWTFLHIISFNYPVNPTLEDRINYKNYLLSLKKILPCKYCRNNFNSNLRAAGFSNAVFKNRDTFSRFIYKFHNTVNKMLGKPKFKTYEFVRRRFEIFRAKCGPPADSSREKGCVVPVNGIKSKTTICIVPNSSKKNTLSIDKKCARKL